MLARVINLSRAARGFHSVERGIVMVEPGASAEIDLADHDVHRAWETAGDIAIRVVEAVEAAGEPAAETPKPKRR